MFLRLISLAALVLAACVFAPDGWIRAAERTATTSPTTQPWYGAIQPYVDTTPADQRTDIPWDSMYIYIESLGRYPRKFSREQALTILLTTNTYASPLVGGGGTRSEQSSAFGVLVDLPDAQAVFMEIYRRGQTAGKLFALAAFREYVTRDKMIRGQFDELAKPLLESGEEIWTHFGCVAKQLPTSSLAKGLTDPGAFWSLTHPYSR